MGIGIDNGKIKEAENMKELKMFIDWDNFLEWRETSHTEVPYLMIDYELRTLRAGVETKCKSWKTAANRFRKALEGKIYTIDNWFDNHYEYTINMFAANSKNERLCEFTKEFCFSIDDDPWHENDVWQVFLEI